MHDPVSHVATETINDVSHGKYSKPRTSSKVYNGPHSRSHINSHFGIPHNTISHQVNRNNGRPQYSHGQNSLKGYYCDSKHCIRDCNQFTQDKTNYKLKTSDIMQKCKDKIIQKAMMDNMSINE